MNRTTLSIIISLVAASAALTVSCSKDPLRQETPEYANAGVFKSDAAYVNVIITEAGSATRASSGDFDYGDDEQTVTAAHFYFYDHFGEFVTRAETWSGGASETGNTDSDTGSRTSGTPGPVEFRSNTVVALDNLSGRTYPLYLVTVLNPPVGFTPGDSLPEMLSKLTSRTSVSGGYLNGGGNFIMSTTSFAGRRGADDSLLPYYCVTEVGSANFSPEPVDLETANPVTVHVERLAAKVTLKVSDNLSNAVDIGGRTLYRIHATIAADPDSDGSSPATETDNLLVELLGWKLNATAKYSYLLKNIDENWTNDEASLGEGWSWNDPSNWRSYWCRSYNYDKGGYPSTSGGMTDGTMLNDYLNYFSLNDTVTPMGGAEYCAENTNRTGEEGGEIRSRHSSAITSALLKARLCNSAGEPVSYLVRYENLLWEKSHYLAYVSNVLTDTGDLNAWYDTGEVENGTPNGVYRHIDASFLDLAPGTDGAVNVIPNSQAEAATFYEADSEGNITATRTSLGTVRDALDAFNLKAGAIGYSGGLMYYNIPVEHLNDRYTDTDSDGRPIVHEANYGIVRNHSYRITVTKLESIGKGISDPEEVIVPTEDLESYYVGARVNILSWKIIDQNVEI